MVRVREDMMEGVLDIRADALESIDIPISWG